MEKLTKIGVQLFTVGSAMQDVEGIKRTFDKLKKIGYDEIQTAGSPCGDAGMISYEEFGRLAREAGLDIVGTHDKFEKLRDETEQAIAEHKLLGTDIMGIGGWWENTVEGYETFIASVNKIASTIAPHGLSFSYHNHCQEFIKLPDGTLPMDRFVNEFDPENVNFVLDTCWLQYAGADVRHWIDKLAGRVKILHLKDMAKEDSPYAIITEIGNGNLWWEGIMESAFRSNVEHFVVEQDSCPGDPFDSLKISSDYLHANFF